MHPSSPTRTFAALAAILVAASACTTGPAASPGSAATPAASPSPAAARATPSATAGASPAALADIGDLLVLRLAAPTPDAGFAVIGPGRGNAMFSFADGVVSRDWQTLASVTPDGSSTRVDVTMPEGGGVPVRISVPGAWRLPTVGVGRAAAGLSADGRVLVLVEPAAAAPASPAPRTRFAIVATSGATPPRVVTLDGSFSFDVVSPDGHWLYLLEHLAGGDPTNYQVRRLDTATGALQEGSIVDKRVVDEQMTGYALTQVAGQDGWVYTLYRGVDGDFVHALDTVDGVAFCVDLPGTAGGDPATDGDWGLATDGPGSWLYVTDGARGMVRAVSLADFSVRMTQQIADEPVVRFAKLETSRPTGGRAALSPDETTLYVATATGVAAIRVADLATIGHLGAGAAYRDVAAGRGGAVYAIDEAGRAVLLGSRGAPDLPVASGTYASIVAVGP
jgi:hypothetical protein